MNDFVANTLIEGGRAIMDLFGRTEILHSKGNDIAAIVTEADLASNAIITGAIMSAYPTHGIVSEETENHQVSAEFMWHLDPLDGTRNFQSYTPLFGINLALAHRGELIFAGIYLPFFDELVLAEAGAGAHLISKNGSRRLECSSKSEWKGAFGIGPVLSKPENIRLQELIFALSEGTAWSGGVGSPAVSAVWLADGRRDWYTGPGKNSWDYAAPALVAKEAGCVVSNFAGEEWHPGDRGLVIANKHLYPGLIQAVKDVYAS